MSRYMDADALKKRMLDYFSPPEAFDVADLMPSWAIQDGIEDIFETFPTADVVDRNECSKCVLHPFKQLREQLETNMVEVVHGEWKPNNLNGFKIYDCSNCGIHMEARWNYCPHCGADMRGGDAK